MKKGELAVRLARAGRISKAKAADQLDTVIHRIVRSLRHGEAAALPGLGTFRPGEKPCFEPERPPRPPKERA